MMRHEYRKSRPARGAFTLAEVMISLMIFAMVATAGTYMMSATNTAQNFFRNGTNSQSELEFALGRMVENVRAATAVASPTSTSSVSTLTITNISGVTVTYTVNSSYCLTEKIGTGTANVLVHGTQQYPVTMSVAETTGNSKAFTIAITAGSNQNIARSITVFGRNL